MKCVYMGKHKRSSVAALNYLTDSGWHVVAVVAPPANVGVAPEQRLDQAARRAGLTLVSDSDLYDAIRNPEQSELDLSETDVVFSFLFWKRIREPLIELGRIGCLNFHPAPLPEMRGVGGYNVAILEDWNEWGVSAHFVDKNFDTGDLVRVNRFSIDSQNETALSLDIRTQAQLLDLFRWVVDTLNDGRQLPREPQGQGRYVTREDFEKMRSVRPDDSLDLIRRRIRAFWYPPYDGATLSLNGERFTLVNRDVLASVADAHLASGNFP